MSPPPAEIVDVTPWSVGWISPDPRFMRRASHAVLAGGGVWFTDPVLDEAALARAAALGPPAGVVQLLDRHPRDCAAVAARLGVPLHVVPGTPPPGAPFEVIPVVGTRVFRWREIALWFPERRALVTADALGSAPYFLARGERLGPHPVLRLLAPPRVLAGRDPEHVLVGHGAGLHGAGTGAEVDAAIAGARRRIPSWAAGLLRRR
ncbi:MAG: hypothetical protein IT200_16940 [Thermoleophilia bacterium]|nr:hypothetical protein [Thermoleophilia bacterium]